MPLLAQVSKLVSKCGSGAGRLVHHETVGEEGTGDEVIPYVVVVVVVVFVHVVGTVNERFEEC